MELWQHYRTLRRRKWVVLTVILCTVIPVGLYFLVYAKDQYVGTSVVRELRKATADFPIVVPGTSTNTAVLDPQIRVANLTAIAQSDYIIEETIKGVSPSMTSVPEQVLQSFRNRLTIVALPQTEHVRVTYESSSKDDASRIVEKYVEVLKQRYAELNQQQSQDDLDYLQGQLLEAKKEQEAARAALQKFQEENRVILPEDEARQKLALYNNVLQSADQAALAVADAETRRRKLEEEVKKIPQTKDLSDAIAINPVWMQLTQTLASLNLSLANELRVHTPEYPLVKNIEMQIEETKKQLKETQEKIISITNHGTNSVYDDMYVRWANARVEELAARSRASAMGAVLQKYSAELERFPANQANYLKYSIEARSKDSLVQAMETQIAEAKLKVNQARNRSTIQVIDPPKAVKVPSRAVLSIVLAFVLSTILGMGLAFLVQYMDNTVRTPEQAEALLQLPIFAVVPFDRSQKPQLTPGNHAMVAAYEMLSTNVWMDSPDVESPTFLIASAEPNVGRSVTAANLAITLARDGARVILVDSDLREPSQHKIFGVSNEKGMTNYLLNGMRVEDVLQKTQHEGMMLVPSGPLTSNPVRLLRSSKMRDFVEQASKLADFVLFDSPAGVTFADAALLANHVKNVIVVHAAGKAPRGAELEFRRRLERIGARLVGAVLNKVRREDSHGYFYFQRAYERVLPAGPATHPFPTGSGNIRAITGPSGDKDSESK
jgi:tyrosine-protein kinase Etk/Wzc